MWISGNIWLILSVLNPKKLNVRIQWRKCTFEVHHCKQVWLSAATEMSVACMCTYCRYRSTKEIGSACLLYSSSQSKISLLKLDFSFLFSSLLPQPLTHLWQPVFFLDPLLAVVFPEERISSFQSSTANTGNEYRQNMKQARALTFFPHFEVHWRIV